ncbi:mandelate racemase/muconate lactonizing enzyme family protein [Corticibacterium sp. UT-5YL-CI-8]|nr:mandelate racemase/muconate lactonizing enzyme family protein [Tianweitania sp. UT-5YL-CI-8]
MKVTALRTVPLRIPLEKPIGNATVTIENFSCLAIFLDTDEGIVGENLIFTIRPEQLKLLDAMVHVLEAAVIGRDPNETEAFWKDAWRRINFIGFAGVSIMGISALDGALWDLRGKACGLSIGDMLGTARRSIKAYASGGLWLTQTVSELAAEAESFALQGFGAMKLRLAGHVDVDLPRIAAVQKAIGLKVDLMVDANQGMETGAAIKLGRRMQDLGVTWFEEPSPAHDLEASAAIAAALDMPVASGENEYTRYGFKRMLDLRAADIIMPDLQRVGGVSEFAKVNALAATYGVPLSSHLFPEQSLQLLASAPTAISLEHLGWFAPLYNETIELEKGVANIPDRPGWGFTFDKAALKRLAF